MRKLIIFLALIGAAGYVATHYLGKAGPTLTGNAHEAEEILK